MAREKADEEYERTMEEKRKRDEEKTGRNKKRRERMKARKGKKGKEDVEMGSGEEDEGTERVKKMKKLGPAKVPVGPTGGDEVEEVSKSVEDVGVVIHDDD